MKSHELAKRLLQQPDEEVRFHELGAVWDWSPTNVYYDAKEGKVMVKNFSNKSLKKQRWPS